MLLRSFRHQRGGVALSNWMALAATAWLACSAPNGSGLFEPFGSAGSAGSGGSGGSSGTGSGGSSAGASALGGTGGTDGEGIGGNLPLAGAAGVGGSGATGGAGTPPSDAGAPDAGAEPDSGPSEPTAPACEPSDELCDGIDNDCDEVIDSGAACPAGCTGFSVADHAYMVCSESVDRGIALARCGGEGMKLAWIETPEENAALAATLASVGLPVAGEVVVQIGASDEEDEDEWSWIGNAAAFDGFQFWSGNGAEDGGEPVGGAYANWASDEPNNSGTEDCGALSISGSTGREPGQWDDRPCLDELPFLCEEP